MSDDANEPDRRPSPIRIDIETQFFDQFAALIPSAPLRQILLEQGVKRSIRQEFAAWRSGQPVRVLLDGGFGLMLTEPLLGIPALLVAFEYDPPSEPVLVTLWRVRLAPKTDETED